MSSKHPQTEIEILDEDTIQTLVKMLEDGLAVVVDEYLRTTPPRLDELRIAARDNDRNRIIRIAHTLKGSSGNLGLTALARACEEIEDNATRNALPDPESAAQVVLAEFERACPVLENLTAKPRGDS